ncbi:hypothetical protein NDU88_003899 [Pleurodeles waltl]|uniref:Uncharacterized protein n=1 Tax=Pleurodeles waltl TaxID=8319 RepID=A0AAV7QDB6_PLEWA|nr:hypothetical protein NDU88_003899 [Pleurodeles waltl]
MDASQGNTMEQYTTSVAPPRRPVGLQVVQPTSTVGLLEVRLEDAEGRYRRNNVRLLGFPERAEGSAVESFVESWIKDMLQLVGLTRVFLVERAHRALVALPQPGAPPRAIITRLLSYKDRDCILRTSLESEKAIYENCKISIYPDYTNKVQNSRKGFMETKAKLRAMNIRYMLLYPARLKVLSGANHTFLSDLRKCGPGWRCGTKWLLADWRDLEAPPNGHRAPEAQTGDHMIQGGWWNLATGWRYSEMEQWRWCL